MDGRELAEVMDRACRLGGAFTLRSGQVESEYFDNYCFDSDPLLLRPVEAGNGPYGAGGHGAGRDTDWHRTQRPDRHLATFAGRWLLMNY